MGVLIDIYQSIRSHQNPGPRGFLFLHVSRSLWSAYARMTVPVVGQFEAIVFFLKFMRFVALKLLAIYVSMESTLFKRSEANLFF